MIGTPFNAKDITLETVNRVVVDGRWDVVGEAFKYMPLEFGVSKKIWEIFKKSITLEIGPDVGHDGSI